MFFLHIKSEEWELFLLAHHRWTGKPQPGLPSGEACHKQSGPEQSELFVGNDSYERVRGWQKHRTLSIADFRLLRAYDVLYTSTPSSFASS